MTHGEILQSRLINGSRTERCLLAILVFMVPFAVYLRTMAPTIYGLDSAELTTGASVLGITHSPGNPLYLLAGHVFCFLPLGDPGWRVNLLSAVCAAGAVTFLWAIVFQVTGRSWLAVPAAWVLGFSYYFWVWALVAELYAPHAFISAALVYLVLKWRATGRRVFLSAAAVLFGLGLGNHTSLVLIAPGLAWMAMVGTGQRKLTALEFGKAVLLSAAGFVCVFSYIPIRHMAHPPLDYVRDYFPEINLLSAGGMAWMVKGGMFSPLLFSRDWIESLSTVVDFIFQLQGNFGVLIILLGCFGFVRMARGWRGLRDVAIGLALMFVIHLAFYASYGATDRKWMYSACYLTWAVFAAAGWAAIDQELAARRRGFVRAVSTVAVCAVVLRLLWSNYPDIDLHDDFSARIAGGRMMSVMKSDAVFIGSWEHAPILEYLQIVEKVRPDIRLVNSTLLGAENVRSLAHVCVSAGVPLYVTSTNTAGDGSFGFQETGVPGLMMALSPASSPQVAE